MKAMLARREERYISYMNTSVSLMSTLLRSIRRFTSLPSRERDSWSRVATAANSLGRLDMSLTNVEQAPGGSSNTHRSSKRLRYIAAAYRDRNGPRLSGLGKGGDLSQRVLARPMCRWDYLPGAYPNARVTRFGPAPGYLRSSLRDCVILKPRESQTRRIGRTYSCSG